MIDHNLQLKIQAFLDGELSEVEAREVAAFIASNAEAAALHAELKNTRRAMVAFEADIKVPETREFYWSRISREISKLEQTPAVKTAPTFWQLLAGWMKPIGAVAAVALVGALAWHQTTTENLDAMVTAQMDADSITFQNDDDGVTFVWFTYPAENRVANDSDVNTLN